MDGPLAAPAGWPDITDELAEVRFLLLQGFEDEAAAMLTALRARFEGHPDLVEAASESSAPPVVDASERRRRDQAVTVRTEPVEAAAAAVAADAERAATPSRTPPTRTAPPPAAAARPASQPATRTAPPPSPTPAETRVVGSTTAPTVTIAIEDIPSAPPESPVPRTPAPPTSRNAQRVPPRGLTIRSEAVDAPESPAESARTLVPQSRVPDAASLVAVSPLDRPAQSPSPADSVSETIEFDVDAEMDGGEATGVSSTVSGLRLGEGSPTLIDDDAGETVVDLEFERLDRTVVSRAPPAPPVFDDEPAPAPARAPAIPESTSEGTVIARAPSRPAPYRGDVDDDRPTTNNSIRVAAPPEPAAPPRTTVVPTDTNRPPTPAPFGGVPPPGSTLVPGTTPPTGGFSQDDDIATVALPQLTDAMAEAPPASAQQAPAVTGLTAPHAVVSTPEPTPAPSPRGGSGRGRGRKDTRVAGVRLVMLGARGEAVAERTIEAGTTFDLGRDGNQPWSDDTFIEPIHARFTAAQAGVAVEELVPTGAVFLRIQGRRPLNEDDQVRVGQSLLSYRRPHPEPNSGPWGSVIMQIAPEGEVLQIPLGNAGVTVGREFGEITLPGDTFVSSTHCRVVTGVVSDQPGIFIEDLDSSNGTYVRLRAGERIEVGQCVLIGQTQFVIRKR